MQAYLAIMMFVCMAPPRLSASDIVNNPGLQNGGEWGLVERLRIQILWLAVYTVVQ